MLLLSRNLQIWSGIRRIKIFVVNHIKAFKNVAYLSLNSRNVLSSDAKFIINLKQWCEWDSTPLLVSKTRVRACLGWAVDLYIKLQLKGATMV